MRHGSVRKVWGAPSCRASVPGRALRLGRGPSPDRAPPSRPFSQGPSSPWGSPPPPPPPPPQPAGLWWSLTLYPRLEQDRCPSSVAVESKGCQGSSASGPSSVCINGIGATVSNLIAVQAERILEARNINPHNALLCINNMLSSTVPPVRAGSINMNGMRRAAALCA